MLSTIIEKQFTIINYVGTKDKKVIYQHQLNLMFFLRLHDKKKIKYKNLKILWNMCKLDKVDIDS